MLEGVSLSLLDCKTYLDGLCIPYKNEATLIGGGAKGELWRQITADMLGLVLRTTESSDSSLGSAMLAGIAVGIFKDAKTAAALCVKPCDVVYPNEQNTAAYRKLFERYKRIHDALKNLTVEVGRIYAECPNIILNIGGIAGAAHNGSLISNCTVTVVNEQSMIASKQVEAGTTANYIGGIVGAMNGSSVEGCTNNCPIKVNNTVNTNNGANSYHVGGIFGFGMGTLSAKNCVNNAEIGGKIGEEYWGDSPRIGGLIGTVHNDQLITIENCTNNGKVLSTIITTSDKSSRAAGIIAYIGGENSLIKGCVNNADICFIREDATGAEYKGYVAGFVGQTNKAIVIEECENYGSLLSDRWFYKEFAEGEGEYPAMGVAFSRPNKTASIVKNCKIGGKIGPYSAPDKVVTFDAGNFNLYMLGDTFAARKNVVFEGNVFASK